MLEQCPAPSPTDGKTLVIEYVLIFALGFFAALLIALVVAPAIHRRIVTLTERRMRASVALTSNEVRAEKDADKARSAMETARLSVRLGVQRDRAITLAAERERLQNNIASLNEARGELERHVDRLAVDGKSLRARLEETESRLAEKVTALIAAETLAEARNGDVRQLNGRAEQLAASLEQFRADLAGRDERIDRLQREVAGLREVRALLRDEVKRATDSASELRLRLEREGERTNELDRKLAESVAAQLDHENALERSRSELERVRADLSRAVEETASMRTAFEAASADRARLRSYLEGPRGEAGPEDQGERIVAPMQNNTPDNAAISRRIERLRNRHNTLVRNLIDARDDAENDHLRGEIAEIAAMMIDLTAVREGPASPIHGILATEQNGARNANGQSLAERTRRFMDASHDGD